MGRTTIRQLTINLITAMSFEIAKTEEALDDDASVDYVDEFVCSEENINEWGAIVTLEPETAYFMRIQQNNAVGDPIYSPVYAFTTIAAV